MFNGRFKRMYIKMPLKNRHIFLFTILIERILVFTNEIILI